MKLSIVSIFFMPFAVIAADTNGLPELAPAYPEMPPTFWEQHGAEIFTGGFTFLAMVAIALWLMFRPRPQEALPPEVVAREALARLRNRAEDGKILSEVSQILRRYVSVAFQFPPAELTTAEFAVALAGNAKIGPELAQAISSFLRECDERKFAPTTTSTPLNAIGRALVLVTEIQNQAAERGVKS